MNLFNSKKFDTLNDLLVEQLEDLYDAEQRLCDALPKMADAATSPELQSAFKSHLDETRQHVTRLEKAFEILGHKATRETCDAMKGLISEGEDMVEAKGDPSVVDAALIAAAQRVEHYEIAAYGTAREFATKLEHMGHEEVASLLQQTLDEEGAADKKLTQIARSIINPQAAATV